MNSTISIYAIPPLISMLFLFSLSLVAFFSGNGKAQWKMLSMFSMLLGLATLFAFLALNDDTGASLKHLQIAPLFGIFSIFFAILYALQLTGQSNFIAKKKTLPTVAISILGLVVWITLLFILRDTHWFIREVKMIDQHKFKVTYGPLFYVFLCIIFFGLGKILINLHGTFKATQDKIFKEYLFLNIIAFRIIYGSVLTLLFILPLLGLKTQIWVFFAFPIGVLIIYIAIMRYQFKQIDEMNINLENKVRERTLELENTQALLVQSKTMASVGQLAAGIAHEINNPIGAMQSIQQSMQKSGQKIRSYIANNFKNIEKDIEFDKFFKVMDETNRITLDGTKRISGIVKAMKNFANLDEAEEQLYDIHEGLNDTIRLLQTDLKTIKIETVFTQVPKILVRPAKLNQVFWNIMQNAVQAVDSKGHIRITTNYHNPNIEIVFRDNGRGMPADIVERVFEPGFTTRGVGVGTGLGLSICYKIIQEHHGTIDIKSNVGQGTTVTLTLPASNGSIA